ITAESIGVGHELPAVEHGELAAAVDPQVSRAILRGDDHAIVVGQRALGAVAYAHERAFLAQHPDIANVIRADGGNVAARAAFVNILRFEFSIVITREIAALMADP